MPDLNSWVKMGEDTYPNVVDTLGALTGGTLVDGTEDDFVEIVTPDPKPFRPKVFFVLLIGLHLCGGGLFFRVCFLRLFSYRPK